MRNNTDDDGGGVCLVILNVSFNSMSDNTTEKV